MVRSRGPEPDLPLRPSRTGTERAEYPPAHHPPDGRRASRLARPRSHRSPRVLVGHSFEAQIVRVYAGTYPDEVAGLVLVDGAAEDLGQRMRPFLTEEGWRSYLESWDAYPNPEDVTLARLPEIEDGLRTTGRSLPDVPLVVLEGTSRNRWEAAGIPSWWPLADALRVMAAIAAESARLTPQGRVIQAERSGHMVHHDQPELVVEAVRRVLDMARR